MAKQYGIVDDYFNDSFPKLEFFPSWDDAEEFLCEFITANKLDYDEVRGFYWIVDIKEVDKNKL